MSEDLVSIIVPVYNVKKYLERCVNSIINQTYKKLEIILIDDGSTDGSGYLCDELKEKDSRIVVIHQKNEGVSNSRNKGIKISTGKYIGFVDSDDYIEKNMVKQLYKNATKTGSDISMCGYNIIKEDSNNYVKRKKDGEKKLLVSKNIDLFYKMTNRTSKGFMWNKLFSREIFNNIEFNKNIKMCEDLLVNIQISNNMKKFCYDDIHLYNYVMRDESAIHNKNYDKYYTAVIAYRIIIDILQKNKSKYVDLYVLDKFKWENGIIKNCKKYKKKLNAETKNDYSFIIKSMQLSLKDKIETIIRYRFNLLYILLKKVRFFVNNR